MNKRVREGLLLRWLLSTVVQTVFMSTFALESIEEDSTHEDLEKHAFPESTFHRYTRDEKA